MSFDETGNKETEFMSSTHPQTLSPLLSILQNQIMPMVQESGMSNIIVAQSTWEAMRAVENELPEGASITPKPLKSKRTPVREKQKYGSNRATLDARWPEDGLHSSRMPILMFVVMGRVAIQLGDYVLHCQSGHGILILPGTPYPDGSHLCLDDSAQENSTCDMLSFKGWRNGVECWLNHTREGRHWSHQAAGENCHVLHPQARIYIETLAEEAQLRLPHSRAMCDGLLRVFTTLLLREIQELRAFQPVQPRQSALDPAAPLLLQEQDPIARATEYVRSHLQENLSIDRMAAYVYMSRAYFTRQFRAATGETFNQYVTGCRLEAAKVLLQDTAWPIEQISDFVGVTSARLRVLFLHNTGLTPSQFRSRVREEKTEA